MEDTVDGADICYEHILKFFGKKGIKKAVDMSSYTDCENMPCYKSCPFNQE